MFVLMCGRWKMESTHTVKLLHTWYRSGIIIPDYPNHACVAHIGQISFAKVSHLTPVEHAEGKTEGEMPKEQSVTKGSSNKDLD